MPAHDLLAQLERDDKHYLGAGDGVVFDPPHPIWLDRPGFWDGGRVYLYSLDPLFTLGLIGATGTALRLQARERRWTPAELAVRYSAQGWEAEERRAVLPGGRFLSEWTLASNGAVEIGIVAWTAQEGSPVVARDRLAAGPGGVRFHLAADDAQRRSSGLELLVSLRFTGAPADSWAVYESQHPVSSPILPQWETTPFRDRWQDLALRNEIRLAESQPAGGRRLVYLGIARRISLVRGKTTQFGVVLEARPIDPGLHQGDRIEAGADESVATSRSAWRGFLEQTPAIRSSDPYVERYLPYRWYGLRLNFLDPAGNYRYPTCAEGTEYFHCAISYSAWCHARELRWLSDPERARGSILTFLAHQRPDGALPGRVYLDHMRRTDHYFADWGGSLLAVDEVHPDRGFLESCYEPLCRYADWVDRERDPEGIGLFDVRDPFETGQEMMSRYTAVDPLADEQHFDFRLRLKGVDLTIYQYRLRRALARVAARLGRSGLVHDAAADRIAAAVRAHLWDPGTELFSDLDPRTMTRTGIKAAVCFYPFMTDIVDRTHLAALERHLFNPAEFWTPFPVPSTSADDPTYSPDAEWKGVRQHCAWNGRVWPMANSHVAEALCRVAVDLEPRYRERAAEFLMRYLRMLFFDRDPARPNSFEHYSPVSGEPCLYRGLDDYQHSWVNDLLIRFVAGARPGANGTLVVDPFPCDIERIELERLPYRGHQVGVELDAGHIRVRVDGSTRAEGEVGTLIMLSL